MVLIKYIIIADLGGRKKFFPFPRKEDNNIFLDIGGEASEERKIENEREEIKSLNVHSRGYHKSTSQFLHVNEIETWTVQETCPKPYKLEQTLIGSSPHVWVSTSALSMLGSAHLPPSHCFLIDGTKSRD